MSDVPLDRQLCMMIGAFGAQGHDAHVVLLSRAVDELDRLRAAEADLAEALSLLRECRDEFVGDEDPLAGRLVALLARHPDPTPKELAR